MNWNYINELSPEANKMLQKFGHYYRFPRTSADLGRSAFFHGFGGILVAIFSLPGFWLGLVIGFVNFFLMSTLVHFFDPHVYLGTFKENRDEARAHEEIVAFMSRTTS